MKKISTNDFWNHYGGATRRSYLIGELQRELRAIRHQKIAFRIYVFGSMLNKKKRCPGDIDVLLTMVRPMNLPRWKRCTSRQDVHIFSSENAYLKVRPPLLNATDMVSKFNLDPGNIRARISLSRFEVMEIV